MNLERVTLSEVSQTKTGKYHMITFRQVSREDKLMKYAKQKLNFGPNSQTFIMVTRDEAGG